MLTARQEELLLFIDSTVKRTGIAPSYDEMAAGLGLKSKSGIHRMICGLERRGFIRRISNCARAIEILRFPDGTVRKQEERIKWLEEALQPFASIDPTLIGDKPAPFYWVVIGTPDRVSFTIDDLQRAKDALEP